MARSKKSSIKAPPAPPPEPVVEAPPAPAPPPVEPVFVRKVLSRAELDGLARWTAEAKYADVYLTLKERDRKELLARIDPKNELAPIDQHIANAKAAKTQAANQYMKITAAASSRLGVDVTKYAYDDETGLLTKRPTE